MPTMKQCTICGERKPENEFYLRKGHSMDRCKACHIKRVRKRERVRRTESEQKARRRMVADNEKVTIIATEGRRLTSVKDACRYANFSQTKCYDLIHRKRIKAYKFDKRTLVDLDSIDAMFRALPEADTIKEPKPIL